MEWFGFGLRDVMLLLVVLAAIYLVFMLLRLVQVGRQRHTQVEHGSLQAPAVETVSPLRRRVEEEPPVPEPEPFVSSAAAAAVAAYAKESVKQETSSHEPFAVPPAPTFDWDDVKDLFGDAAEVPGASLPAATPRRPGFGEHLSDHLARSDVEMEVQRMRDEMERMRAEVEELRAAHRVSPQYSEAMELAQRGMSAQDVADRLGISLAEAELVHALSRGSKNFDEGDEHGAAGYATNDGFDEFGHRTRHPGG
jgi:hypothetical protein